MNKSIKSIIIILLTISLIFGIWTVSTYNTLVAKEESINMKFSSVQTAYQRRADLIPNLAESVKQYAKHEEIFVDIAKARSNINNAQTPDELQNSDNMIKDTLKSLFMVVESYPELKANENFLALQDELAGTENRIKVERDAYNKEVRDYNTYIRQFPTIITASILGFDKKEMFKAESNAQKSISIKDTFEN